MTVLGSVAVVACAAVVALNTTLTFAVASESATPGPTASQPAVPHLEPRRLHGQTVSSRTVVLRGSGLDDVASVSLGTASLGAPVHLGPHRIAIRIGPSPTFAPGAARLVLHRASDGSAVRTAVRFAYVATTVRARELQYAWANLHRRAYTWGHGYITRYDCANFTSHALVAAGLDPSLLDVSSTSLRRKLLAAGATELRDTQANRAKVRIGDVIQFDWQPTRTLPGDRDHTGIVTGIARASDGRILVRYSAHTDGGNDPAEQLLVERTMNRPHHDPHGKVYFLHLPV